MGKSMGWGWGGPICEKEEYFFSAPTKDYTWYQSGNGALRGGLGGTLFLLSPYKRQYFGPYTQDGGRNGSGPVCCPSPVLRCRWSCIANSGTQTPVLHSWREIYYMGFSMGQGGPLWFLKDGGFGF